MSICKDGIAPVKKLLTEIGDEAQVLINDLIGFGNKIQTLEKNPAVEIVVAMIPGAPGIEAAANVIINELTSTASIIAEPNTPQKLTDFINELDTISPRLANAKVFKFISGLIQSLVTLNSGGVLTEVEADSLTQLEVLMNKQAA